MYYGLHITNTNELFLIALLVFLAILNIIVIIRWYFFQLPKFKKDSKILLHRIDGNIAALNVIRYINSNQLQKLYVSRDMFNAFFRIVSTFKVQPYYFYYVDYTHVQTDLTDTYQYQHGLGYRFRSCKFVIDPYRRNFSYGRCLNKDYINTIEDLYS